MSVRKLATHHRLVESGMDPLLIAGFSSVWNHLAKAREAQAHALAAAAASYRAGWVGEHARMQWDFFDRQREAHLNVAQAARRGVKRLRRHLAAMGIDDTQPGSAA